LQSFNVTRSLCYVDVVDAAPADSRAAEGGDDGDDQ
jgi:hypothetical protein